METQQNQQQQQQQHENQYQYQTLNNPPNSTTTTQSYDSSTQIQSYDPQSYYASYPQQHYQNTPDYSSATATYDASSSYYNPNYSNSYQIHDPNSIHPPGVPVSAENQQTQVLNSQNLYHQSSQTHGYLQPAQPVYGGGDSQGGRSTRGRGRGTFGRRGGGRGGGRGQAAPSKPPPQMAWCELCRVDCITLEILEKHKNGKKHLRNLKVFEELQNTTKPITVVNPQASVTQPKPEESTPMVNTAEPTQESVTADKILPTVAQPSEEAIRNDSFTGRGGLKRKMKAGRGGKWVRTHDGSKILVEPRKPKQMVPILCELCNVKCESQVVYESHVAGKKHLSTLKRYQGHKETFGDSVEALYPTIPNLPSISVASQPQQHQQIPQDAQALASMMLGQQNLPDPQAAQAALAQLLNQHGIHDAQTLIVQLIPYLLTQSQVPGSVPVSVPGLGSQVPGSLPVTVPGLGSQVPGSLPVSVPGLGSQVPGSLPVSVPGLGLSALYPQSQVPHASTEAGSQHDGNKSDSGAGTSDKPNDGPSEATKAGND